MTKIFEGVVAYISNALKDFNPDTETPKAVGDFIIENGGNVPGYHIIGSTDPVERQKIFEERSGLKFDEFEHRELLFYLADFKWEFQDATHFIAFTNGGSLGVGKEIAAAMFRYLLTGVKLPVLCLVKDENMGKLTPMVRGRGLLENFYHVREYRDTQEAIEIVKEFILTGFPNDVDNKLLDEAMLIKEKLGIEDRIFKLISGL